MVFLFFHVQKVPLLGCFFILQNFPFFQNLQKEGEGPLTCLFFPKTSDKLSFFVQGEQLNRQKGASISPFEHILNVLCEEVGVATH